jgi:hypothetical protein
MYRSEKKKDKHSSFLMDYCLLVSCAVGAVLFVLICAAWNSEPRNA